MRSEATLGIISGYAILSYSLFRAGLSPVGGRTEQSLAFLAIFLAFSPLLGLIAFGYGESTNSARHSVALGGLTPLVVAGLFAADPVTRPFVLPSGSFLLSGFLLYLLSSGAFMLMGTAGAFWPWPNSPSRILRLKGMGWSRVLSIVLIVSGLALWYFGVFIPVREGLGR